MKCILGIAAVCAIGSSAFGQVVAPAIGEFKARGGSPGAGGFVDADVYDNSFNLLGSLIIGADRDWGDSLTLAGTEREVTLLSLYIHANSGTATADVQVRIFAGGDASGGDPCEMLWESKLFVAEEIFGGTTFYDFDVPNVPVPDEITWTLELTNVTAGAPGAATGSRFIHPPDLGSSEDWIWNHTGGVWEKVNIAGLESFGAYITAVGGKTGEECGTCTCACDMDLSTGPGMCDLFDFLAFQGGFVKGETCQCDIDLSTGPDVCDLFDFLAFQGEFVKGCP